MATISVQELRNPYEASSGGPSVGHASEIVKRAAFVLTSARLLDRGVIPKTDPEAWVSARGWETMSRPVAQLAGSTLLTSAVPSMNPSMAQRVSGLYINITCAFCGMETSLILTLVSRIGLLTYSRD